MIIQDRSDRLFRAEDPVAGIAQTGNDIGVLVEALIKSGAVYGNVRMFLGDALDSRRSGDHAYHAEILIENAVNDADLIIAPDGISGNLIFRTMHLIGGALALGAPIINIDKVFIDTSRAKKDYKDSIALAMRLTEGKI